jgi:uncharacterized membrane protein
LTKGISYATLEYYKYRIATCCRSIVVSRIRGSDINIYLVDLIKIEEIYILSNTVILNNLTNKFKTSVKGFSKSESQVAIIEEDS